MILHNSKIDKFTRKKYIQFVTDEVELFVEATMCLHTDNQ